MGKRKLLSVMHVFIVLIVLVSQLYIYVKTYQIIYTLNM